MREHLLQFIFYVAAALSIFGAVSVVLQKNPVRAVLSLVFSFFMIAIVWMMCQAEFLALVLVLVYVGAVMTLFLFVVMMLNIDVEVEQPFPKLAIPVAISLLIALLGIFWMALPKDLLPTAVEQMTSGVTNTAAIGNVLYTNYTAMVELTAVLLLVAIVSSIALAHRQTRHANRQDVKKQIMVSRKQRVQLIDMPSENNQ